MTRERCRILQATGNDTRFVSICEEWGWDVAGPSWRGSFLVLDDVGRAWLFSPLAEEGAVWGRQVVEAVWNAFNVAVMSRVFYELPLDEEGVGSVELALDLGKVIQICY